MATRIYTRTGDAGETGLLGGKRLPKDDLRVVSYGTVDELNAVLGTARAAGAGDLDGLLRDLQHELFDLGAGLATPPEAGEPPGGVTHADVEKLEAEIDRADRELPKLKAFILPAGTPLAASLHLARAVCRRAERDAVTLRRAEPETPAVILAFLNRLSDLLFVLARLANHRAGVADTEWARA
ncbi:MAG: cob(I)yrinic acid a,c-diamide adenosyltransferase [Myxococcota bacterium]